MKSSIQDKTEGTAKNIAGNVKAAAGERVGNPRRQADGNAAKVEGQLQKKVVEIMQGPGCGAIPRLVRLVDRRAPIIVTAGAHMLMPVFALFIATLVAALAGCSSNVSPRGQIHVGDTPETVQGAMGVPDAMQDGPDTGAKKSVWIYSNHRQERREKTGWSRVLVPGVYDQNDTMIHEPVTHDVYRTPANDDIRVTFASGVVSSIEQLEP